MKSTLTLSDLASSVVSVPPLCRNADFTLNTAANAQQIKHLESGGVRILLYGGNANLYNTAPSEYPQLLDELAAAAGPETVIIPSVGPYYGTMMDQASLFRSRNYPTAMILPTLTPAVTAGVATSVRHFTDKAGIPAVMYIKNDGYTTVADVAKLVNDGCISWIKYAVVRPDEGNDPFLQDLVQQVDPKMIISGMGEQPVIVHLRDFKLGGFTSGCVCVAPRLSMAMLAAAKAGDWQRADEIRKIYLPLEDLRNNHGPIPVLHHAVSLAGIAETGPMLPLLADLPSALQATIREAAVSLLAKDTPNLEGQPS
jgi:dihydrodipicolinate synthase/N-acetylneuraminate lyase